MNDLTPQPRPKFAVWLFERRISHEQASRALSCSREYVRLICLPFSDEASRAPSAKLRQRIADWTQGEVELGDWTQPQEVADVR